MLITDSKTKYRWCTTKRTESYPKKLVEILKLMMKQFPSSEVKAIHYDRGSELINSTVKTYLS